MHKRLSMKLGVVGTYPDARNFTFFFDIREELSHRLVSEGVHTALGHVPQFVKAGRAMRVVFPLPIVEIQEFDSMSRRATPRITTSSRMSLVGWKSLSLSVECNLRPHMNVDQVAVSKYLPPEFSRDEC